MKRLSLGSIAATARNAPDEFSDIDIGVDVSGYDDGCFVVEEIDPLVRACALHPVLFHTSLTPENYVVTFFLDGLRASAEVLTEAIRCLGKTDGQEAAS